MNNQTSRTRPISAGGIDPLDHMIATMGGETTSSYDELPHQLKRFKQQPMSVAGRVFDLKQKTPFLWREIQYFELILNCTARFNNTAAKLQERFENINDF